MPMTNCAANRASWTPSAVTNPRAPSWRLSVMVLFRPPVIGDQLLQGRQLVPEGPAALPCHPRPCPCAALRGWLFAKLDIAGLRQRVQVFAEVAVRQFEQLAEVRELCLAGLHENRQQRQPHPLMDDVVQPESRVASRRCLAHGRITRARDQSPAQTSTRPHPASASTPGSVLATASALAVSRAAAATSSSQLRQRQASRRKHPATAAYGMAGASQAGAASPPATAAGMATTHRPGCQYRLTPTPRRRERIR